MDEKIELLAMEKPFEALSAEERLWVLAEMSQAEFDHLRSVLLTARQMDAGVLPPARLKADLLRSMGAQPNPATGMRKLLTAKMPIWAAAAALFIGVMVASRLTQHPIQEKIVQVVQLQTDTIWLDKIVWRERILIREKIVCPEKSTPEPLAIVPQMPKNQALEPVQIQAEFTLPKVGSALSDTPELMQFFTQGDR